MNFYYTQFFVYNESSVELSGEMPYTIQNNQIYLIRSKQVEYKLKTHKFLCMQKRNKKINYDVTSWFLQFVFNLLAEEEFESTSSNIKSVK